MKYMVTTLLFIRTNSVYVQLIRNMTHKIFVYGTLKKNEPNHNLLANPQNGNSKFISEGRTQTKYPLIIATKYNIPFLLYNPGDGCNVKGEIYEVDDKMLANLDILEGHPEFYVRDISSILVKKGECSEIVQAWVYFLKNYRRSLLSKDKMESYSSKGPHGLVYMESSERDPNYDCRVEIRD